MDDLTICTSSRWVQQYLLVRWSIIASIKRWIYKFSFVSVILLELTSEDLVKGLQQLQMTKVRKKILDFEVSIPNRPVFALIEDPQSKVPRNAYFGHQRAAHFGHQRAKTSNSHFSTNLGPRGLKFFLGHSMSPIKNHACNNWNLWNFAS